MKLYTEEQVRRAIELARDEFTNDLDTSAIIRIIYPIYLPSDEDIEDYIERLPYMRDLPLNVKDGVMSGAKWMKEQIINNEK